MISADEMEKILPSPVKLEICCEPDMFRAAVKKLFREIREEHNSRYADSIETVTRHYLNFEDNENDLRWNEFRIFVGKNVVSSGIGPDLDCCDENKINEFYRSLAGVVAGVLDTWHEEICLLQEVNHHTLEDLDYEGYDEMLYAYYSAYGNKKAFCYLKRLGTRYPNSKYGKMLFRAYKNGIYGCRKSNPALAFKMRSPFERENF